MSAERAKGFVPEEQPSGVRVKRQDLASWAATAKVTTPKKPKAVGISAASYNRASVAIDEMMRTGDYSQATPLSVFALFCKMHEHCYGVEMGENTPAERSRACMQIGGFLRNQLSGDVEALVDFVRWAWRREIATEAWRRSNPGRGGSRLQVRWTFIAQKLTDYRVDMARAHAK